MRVGFTGTRFDITQGQYGSLVGLLETLNPEYCHHGDCKGADTAFHYAVAHQNRKLVIHPPVDESDRAFNNYGTFEIRPPKTYLARNRDIVNESDLLIGIPNSFVEQNRSGTWYTIRYARKMHKPVYIIFPDGNIKLERNE